MIGSHKVSKKNYCQPVFARGTGLGNKLFVWARCYQFSIKTGACMVQPKWASMRRGALFRGGVDLRKGPRKIWIYDNFKKSYPDLPKKKFVSIDVIDSGVSSEIQNHQAEGMLFLFKGEGDQFRTMAGDRLALFEEFKRNVKAKWFVRHKKIKKPYIAVNIRTGKDFNAHGTEEDFQNLGALLTPIEWFRKRIVEIRNVLGSKVPVLIISDGEQRHMKGLDGLDVKFFNGRSAVEDLLILTGACLIIGSGGSSFSAWGAFFSGAPIVTIAGQSMSWFGLDQCENKLYTVGLHEEIDPSVLKSICNETD